MPPVPKATSDVFISYASPDTAVAETVCAALERAGVRCWIAPRDVSPGEFYADEIVRALNASRILVLVLTEAAVASPHVLREVERTSSKRHPIVTLRVTAAALPPALEYFLSASHWLDAGAAGVERALPKLVEAVQRLLASSPGADGAKAATELFPNALAGRASQRLSWAVIALTAVVAVGLTYFAVDRLWLAKRLAHEQPAVTGTPAVEARAVIPEKSVAVLPFLDLSEKKDQEFFSDGLAEELLNMLSQLKELHVAARTSAFSFKGKAEDVPTIARKLLVAHVLEGSVRRSGNHLRVTAQLVRADSGYRLWSETYDRELGDVLKVQSEIAAAVSKALRVSLFGAGGPRAAASHNTDAYLTYLQGRAWVSSQRLTDVRRAADAFTRVIRLDPDYGPAYAELAAAKLLLAEFEVSGDRQVNFNSAVEQAKVLIERALALEPLDGRNYVTRGYLRAFNDLSGAEADYRRGLALTPNDAKGYEGLAAVLYENPMRRDEALKMLDRARALDPLEPKYAVLKSLFLDFGRSDERGADALLSEVLRRNPAYQPALMRRASVRGFGLGLLADGIRDAEQALALDPLSEWTRRMLTIYYVDLGEVAAAEAVARDGPHPLPIHRLAAACAARDWRRAGELVYAAINDGTLLLVDTPLGTYAIRMHARTTHQYARARAVLERLSGVTWNAAGVPQLPLQLGMATPSVGLGDVLLESGEKERGRRLLQTAIAEMDYAARELKRGDNWYVVDRVTAVALLGDPAAALAGVRKAPADGLFASQLYLVDGDPAFDAIRSEPVFQQALTAQHARLAVERQKLARLRAQGLVPPRGVVPAAAKAAPAPAAPPPPP